MSFKNDTCPNCGQQKEVLPSNNPLVKNICLDCVKQELKYNDVRHGEFFCRTYNIKFDPQIWVKMAEEYGENVFKEYVKFMEDTDGFSSDLNEHWDELQKEWNLIQTHEALIRKIEPIKDGYMQRNQIKWGANYTFAELITLENLFVNTLKANNVSNPMQKDAIKKACKMSVQLDRAIINGDSKEINELSKSYQNFVKTAKIDDLITASSQDVISNVAQLVQYIEEKGFEFDYYDGVSRDIVDESLKDIQQFLQRLVMDSTGLESVFETIDNALKNEKAVNQDAESYEKVPLEDLYSGAIDEQSKEFDKELEEEEIDEDIMEDDENEFF